MIADKALAKIDVVLTTYGMLRRQEWILDVDWRIVVLDEAQAIKNPSANQTKTVKRLKADAKIALTGTPVENRLSDLWSLFDFLCPGLLGSQKKFKEFVKRLNEREEGRYAPLRGLVQPYILRRLKTDKSIISDLPEKTEVRAFCSLSKRQASLYAKMVEEMADALENLDGMQRRGLVLAYLMRFKQLCNHPGHLLVTGTLPRSRAENSRGWRKSVRKSHSDREGLVFTQFREMTAPLSEFLTSIFDRTGLVLHGGTAVGKRKKLVDQFQQDGGPPFWSCRSRPAVPGLNLTAASHVIHFDRWWNPAWKTRRRTGLFALARRTTSSSTSLSAADDRREDRCLIEEKTQLASDLLEGGAEKMLTEMTDSQLIELVSLDVNKAIE